MMVCAARPTARIASEREEEHQHRAQQRPHEHGHVTDVDRKVRDDDAGSREHHLHFVDVGRKQQEGGQCRAAHRISFGQGFGGVADGVQPVGAIADVFRLRRHFDDAARIVGDRAERIHGQNVGRGGQHAHRRDRGAV